MRDKIASLPQADDSINFDHMRLLVHATTNEDLFNIGVGLEDYHASVSLGLEIGLKSPYLMYEILAYSARHLAFLHPTLTDSYFSQATRLQTRAVSLFRSTPLDIDQATCVPILLFSTVLGLHLLADTLVKRDVEDLKEFVEHYVQCAQTYRGVYNIAVSAWPLLMESELGPMLVLSKNFTSQQPKGDDCQPLLDMLDSTADLSDSEMNACRLAVQYLQVGFDATPASHDDVSPNRHQMLAEWTMLATPEFIDLLAAMKPEALLIFAYYALLLDHGRNLWQVRDAGAYIIGLIQHHLGRQWCVWLQNPIDRVIR